MRRVFLAVFLLAVAGRVFAQSAGGAPPESGAPPQNVNMHIGPLFLNPKLNLTNAGVDNNVFNVSDQNQPQSDFTVTVSPATDLWLRMGSAWLSGTIEEDLVWYQKFANQRSANNIYKVKAVIPFNRITFTPDASYTNTRDRPGYEIDARVQQYIADYGGTVEVQALSKTFFGVRADRQTLNFAADAVFRGFDLQNTLTQTITTEALTVRNQLTPLTTLTLDVAQSQDRFPYSPERASDATSVTASIKFDPEALIKGGAMIGFEDFKPLAIGLPGYRGSVAAVNLSYVAFSVTKFDATVNRSVQYSYDIVQPYYVQTALTGSVSQQIFGPFDVVVRGTLGWLAYQDLEGAAIAVSNRVDRMQGYGGGIGYHLSQGMRIGFNLDQVRRLSDVPGVNYSDLQYGFAVTYGS